MDKKHRLVKTILLHPVPVVIVVMRPGWCLDFGFEAPLSDAEGGLRAIGPGQRPWGPANLMGCLAQKILAISRTGRL
jgi:hypothetical protein